MESSHLLTRDGLVVALLVGLSAGIAYVISGDISRTIIASSAVLALFLLMRILSGLRLQPNGAHVQSNEVWATPAMTTSTPERSFAYLRMDVPSEIDARFLQCWEEWMNWTAARAGSISDSIELLRDIDNSQQFHCLLVWEKAEALEQWGVNSTNLTYQAELRSMGVSMQIQQLTLARSIDIPDTKPSENSGGQASQQSMRRIMEK